MAEKTPTIGLRGRSPGMRGGTGEKAKNFKKAFGTFATYLRPYWVNFIVVGIFVILSTACTVISPKMLGEMTDVVMRGIFGHSGIDFHAIAGIGFWLVGLYVASGLFGYAQSWIMTTISQKITYAFRRDISQKISKLPLRYFDQHENGDVISRVTNDVEMISQNLNQSMLQAVTSAITIVGILVMMLTINWQMTLVAVVILPVSIIFVKLIVTRSQRYYNRQQAALGAMDGHIEEMFGSHVIVKAFNGEDRSITRFGEINGELYNSGWKSQFLSGLMMPITTLVSNLGYVAVAVVGGRLAIAGSVSIGDIQAFIQYMNQFTQPISQTANIANVFQTTAAAAERIFNFLGEKEELPEIDTLATPKAISGEVEFKNVSFSYDAGRPIIKNFTAHIAPRSNVAIVGPTGAGKTTIVNLLMRFYDIASGTMTIDGLDIEKMKRQDVRRLFGMVLQDTWLFNGTVAENIAFGRTDATRAEIVQAAQEAYIDHFIRTLPNGYDTVLGDSVDVTSAGEKQLLTIARAILADAPMLILDEATSSVDTRTETLIQAAMEKLTRGRTSFVIAHRLSTIRNATLILVMRDGNIVEQGNHHQLLAANGFYASLYNSQFTEATD